MLCECGREVQDSFYESHLKTIIHNRFLRRVKVCCCCKLEKSFSEFSKACYNGYSWLSSKCLECLRINYQNSKVDCVCGLQVSKLYLRKHKKHSTHKKRMLVRS